MLQDDGRRYRTRVQSVSVLPPAPPPGDLCATPYPARRPARRRHRRGARRPRFRGRRPGLPGRRRGLPVGAVLRPGRDDRPRGGRREPRDRRRSGELHRPGGSVQRRHLVVRPQRALQGRLVPARERGRRAHQPPSRRADPAGRHLRGPAGLRRQPRRHHVRCRLRRRAGPVVLHGRAAPDRRGAPVRAARPRGRRRRQRSPGHPGPLARGAHPGGARPAEGARRRGNPGAVGPAELRRGRQRLHRRDRDQPAPAAGRVPRARGPARGLDPGRHRRHRVPAHRPVHRLRRGRDPAVDDPRGPAEAARRHEGRPGLRRPSSGRGPRDHPHHHPALPVRRPRSRRPARPRRGRARFLRPARRRAVRLGLRLRGGCGGPARLGQHPGHHRPGPDQARLERGAGVGQALRLGASAGGDRPPGRLLLPADPGGAGAARAGHPGPRHELPGRRPLPADRPRPGLLLDRHLRVRRQHRHLRRGAVQPRRQRRDALLDALPLPRTVRPLHQPRAAGGDAGVADGAPTLR